MDNLALSPLWLHVEPIDSTTDRDLDRVDHRRALNSHPQHVFSRQESTDRIAALFVGIDPANHSVRVSKDERDTNRWLPLNQLDAPL